MMFDGILIEMLGSEKMASRFVFFLGSESK